MLTYNDIATTTTALEWNLNGSMLGAISKSKQLHLFDPRKEGGVLSAATHEGTRPQKLAWLGQPNQIFTAGFSRISEKEYCVFDMRDMTQPLVRRRLDEYAGIPFSYFDEDTNLLYIAGKGETNINFYQYSPESPNIIDYLQNFKSKEPQKGFSFLPKRTVDAMKCEIGRGVRITSSSLEYVAFKVPRKAGNFQADLFPPCRAPEAATKFE